jgi:hypothetical protein
MRDVFNDTINAPPGRLAEILLRKMPERGVELPGALLARFDRLVDAPGKTGVIARARLSADVAFLFARAPEWTKSKLLPHFEWSSPDAADIWSARKYSSVIGSPELFGLMKEPFLELFGRNDIPAEELDIFAEWLAAILTANQSEGAGYPLTSTEARSALRRAGAKVLSRVGHRLATEMESAKSQKIKPNSGGRSSALCFRQSGRLIPSYKHPLPLSNLFKFSARPGRHSLKRSMLSSPLSSLMTRVLKRRFTLSLRPRIHCTRRHRAKCST